MSGISTIIEIIETKSEDKVKGVIREAELQKEEVIKKAKEKAEEIQAELLKKAKAESDAELARQAASAKLKAKYKVLEAKEAIMKEVLASAEADIKMLVKGGKYEETLTRLAVAAGKALNEDKLEIVVPKGQEKAVNVSEISKMLSDELGRKITVKIAKDTIRSVGGLIVRNSGNTKWVDNTFEARIERLEKKIRDATASFLFESTE